LCTPSLFGHGKRLVLVESADPFVSAYRDRLEEYVDRARTSAVLYLEVESWLRTTRQYKAVESRGLPIECRAPEKSVGKRKEMDEGAVRKWLIERARSSHQFQLEATGAEVLLQLVGPEFGLLEQSLAKLALFTEPGGPISARQVEDIVGGWRSMTVWDLVEAAVEGRTAVALQQLDRLLYAGEHPLALLGQIAWSLRRFAAATRIFEEAERQGRRCTLSDALIQAGFPHWNRTALGNAERQLKHLGRQRAGQLYRWLLETDLALKGSHSSPQRARLALETLFLRMAG
jgi:DNA polymerase-3 subunit delta